MRVLTNYHFHFVVYYTSSKFSVYLRSIGNSGEKLGQVYAQERC